MNKEKKIQIHHPNGMNYTTCYKPLLCGGESKPISEVVRMDNMQFMAAFPDNFFDLAIVDPPYGINENGQRNLTGDRPTTKWKNPKSIKYKAFDDSKPPQLDYWIELERVSKNRVVWGGNYFTEYLPPSKGWIVWNKQADIKEHLSMAELAWTSFDIKCNMFNYLWAGFKKRHQVERIHPTQKPIDLYRFILTYYAKQGQKILDTHLGSQSSRLAAWEMGFDFYGCEIDKDYFEDGCQRFTNETKQLSLWVG